MNEPQIEAMIEHLLMQNAIEFSGIDENTNEMLYSITDKLKEVSPVLYKDLKDQFEDHIFKLAKRGPESVVWKIR